MPSVSPDIIDRFLARTDKASSLRGCWLWTGAPDSKGYGAMQSDHVRRLAHRLSYELFVAPIPAGLWVLHRCDVPLCVNPDHLFLGNATDNARDMAAKERCGRTTLTGDQVREIRALYANGGISQHQLARRFSVGAMTINRIVNRKRWLHID